MSEQENTALVRRSYELFKSGDIEALLGLYSEDIQWEVPETQSVPFTGRRKGRQAVTDFFRTLEEAQESLSFEPQEFIAERDKVVVLGQYSWRVRATGREYKGEFAHVATVRNGQIVGFKEYTDTAAAEAAHRQTANA